MRKADLENENVETADSFIKYKNNKPSKTKQFYR